MKEIKEPLIGEAPGAKAYLLVIAHIKTLFQQGKIHFGEKLPSERTLMTTLGLSRNSVREALRSLENMGIIESHHGQGNYLINNMAKSLGSMLSLLLFVNECSYTEISQFRKSVEIGACLFAISHAPESEIHSFEPILSKLKDSISEERAQLDKEFHDFLIALSGNRLMGLVNDALSELFAESIRETLSHISSKEWETLLACHTQIYEALLHRKKADCITAIMGHYDLLEKISDPKTDSPL